MHILEVTDHRLNRLFLDVVDHIYNGDSHWIRPLDRDISTVFDPARNVAYAHGEASRWVLLDERGRSIGRIAAFIDRERRGAPDKLIGGCGYFECQDDQRAADLLFDTAANWLKSKGMKGMEGPVNFGENHMWWGLLVEGFTQPYYGMNYHPTYYQHLFRTYGFEVDYVQISNKIEVGNKLPERFERIADWVSKRPGHTFKHVHVDKLSSFTRDFVEIYNDGWQDFSHFKSLTEQTVLQEFESMKAVMDPELIWFAYVNNIPAAFLVVLPDANELIKGLNGRLDVSGKIKFLWNRYTRKHKRMRALIMGTRKRFRHIGLESALFIQLRDAVLRKGHYQELELSWVGDFNQQMMSIHHATGAVPSKKHLTMICHFDD
jgi:hypothetical protein